MTTLKFDATPTPSEGISLDDISEDKMKAAWKDYESKPEYKKFIPYLYRQYLIKVISEFSFNTKRVCLSGI